MAKNRTEIHVTTVFDGELDAADVSAVLDQPHQTEDQPEPRRNKKHQRRQTLKQRVIFGKVDIHLPCQ